MSEVGRGATNERLLFQGKCLKSRRRNMIPMRCKDPVKVGGPFGILIQLARSRMDGIFGCHKSVLRGEKRVVRSFS